MQDIVIRRMTVNDAPFVHRIEALCFSDPWSEEAFKEAADDSNYLFFVATFEDEIIGMAGLILSPFEGTLTNIAVLPEMRDKHIGHLLVDRVLAEGRQMGLNSFTLEVRKSNTAAIRLYEDFGFENAGIRPGFYDHPKEDAIVYWINRQD